MLELKVQTISTMYATAAGSGNMKMNDFKKFLDSFDKTSAVPKEDVEETMRKLKSFGVNLEEN